MIALSAAEQATEQYLPVPLKIWQALKVSPVDRMVQFWASLEHQTRQDWMKLAKCREYDMPGTPTWMALEQDDRVAILRVMNRVRSIYVASDFTTNWRIVAAMGK